MPKLVRRACIWLLLAAVPFHALTALYLDWRGPAHLHDNGAVSSRQGYDHVHEGAARHGHYAHVHGHLLPERHHHSSDDRTVVEVDSRAGSSTAAISSGWSATMVAVLVSAAPDFSLPPRASVRHSGAASFPAIHFFSRLERPPRASHA